MGSNNPVSETLEIQKKRGAERFIKEAIAVNLEKLGHPSS